jgi:GNAT superfamily N-acetyltransferase
MTNDISRETPYVIRRALLHEADALARLATRVYYDTFVDHTAAEDMERFLAATYNEAQQKRELEDEDIETLVVDAGGALIAYAQLRRNGEVPACVDGPAPLELARFYVDHAWHGLGVAHALMQAVEAAAAACNAKTLWLGVWERNFRAMVFYTKFGFHKVGAHPFLVGTDLQTDELMMRTL